MIDGLKMAQKFHEAYERLAPAFGYETRKDTKVFDPESQNGRLMIAVCEEVVGEVVRAAYVAGIESVNSTLPRHPNQG